MRGRDTEYVKPDNIYREKADAHAKRDHIKKKKKRNHCADAGDAGTPHARCSSLSCPLRSRLLV